MKRTGAFFPANVIALLIGLIGIIRQVLSAPALEINLPAGFPTATGFAVIWTFLFILWALATYFVYSAPFSPRRKRNIFLNSLMLIVGIFVWCYMVFSAVNVSGALAVSIAILLLALVLWAMYLVSHRYGGYLFTPVVVWMFYLLYLSISLVVRN